MPRGRPRKNDPEDVLAQALTLFWKYGYEATSMNDIAAETGMAKPGLYTNFGNKDQLYVRALKRYIEEIDTAFWSAFTTSEEPIEIAVSNLLNNTISGSQNAQRPCGCFLVNTLVETSDKPSEVATLGRELSAERRGRLAEKFRQAAEKGELSSDADPESMADFVFGQIMAISAMSSEGVDTPKLTEFAKMGLKALPLANVKSEAL